MNVRTEGDDTGGGRSERVRRTHEHLHSHSKWIFGRSRAFTNNPGWQASRTLPS